MLCSWSNANSIIASSATRSENKSAGFNFSNNQFAPSVFKQDFGYNDKRVRKLLNASHVILQNLQTIVKESDTNTLSADVLQNLSKEIRVVIRDCCLHLKKDSETVLANASDADRDTRQKYYAHLLNAYRQAELVWSLCDALFFRPHDNLPMLDLLEWSRWNFTASDASVTEMLSQKTSFPRSRTSYGAGDVTNAAFKIEEHPDYWNTVYSFILTGRIPEANALLLMHSNADVSPALECMHELLRDFPFSQNVVNIDRADYSLWQERVKRRLENGEFLPLRELELIAKVLIGDEQSFHKLSPICRSWYSAIVGKILFTEPFAKLFDFRYHAEMCSALIPSSNENAAIDEIILSLFQLDIVKAVKTMCSAFQNWWCPAHMVLLLWYAGCTELSKVEDTLDLKEYLLFEFADSLMSEENLWQIAADYFGACPTAGISALSSHLQRLSASNDRYDKTVKIIEVCRKYNLNDTIRTICKERAIATVKKGDISAALTWCLQANDSEFAVYLIDQILVSYGRKGLTNQLACLDSLGESVLLNSSLTFLGKYREMHRLQECGQAEEAAALLVELIDSQISPRRFWPVLFRDVTALMTKSNDMIFDAEKIYVLMDALNLMLIELQQVNNNNYFVDKEEKQSFLDDLRSLKMALVTNLGRSIMLKK